MFEPRRALAILLLALSTACHTIPWNARAVPECPGELVPTDQIEGEFLIRQHLRVTAQGRSYSMELALQKRDDELVLVGLHPLGAKLFTIRQIGTDVTFEALPAPALEIPPENVLRDIHRVNFLSLPQRAIDGNVRGRRGNTEIREIWEAGKLRERSFVAADGATDIAHIAFSVGTLAGEDVASLHHLECGYHAEFRTFSRQDLP